MFAVFLCLYSVNCTYEKAPLQFIELLVPTFAILGRPPSQNNRWPSSRFFSSAKPDYEIPKVPLSLSPQRQKSCVCIFLVICHAPDHHRGTTVHRTERQWAGEPESPGSWLSPPRMLQPAPRASTGSPNPHPRWPAALSKLFRSTAAGSVGCDHLSSFKLQPSHMNRRKATGTQPP